MKTKTFDAVEMKRRGAEKLQAKLEGLTPEEKQEFWRQATEKLRQRQREIQSKLEGQRKAS